MAHDPDPFTRWEAGQSLAREEMLARAGALMRQAPKPAPLGLAQALARELDRAEDDAAFAALALRLPDLADLIQHADAPDPECLHQAREDARRAIATELNERLLRIVEAPHEAQHSISAAAAGRRALKAAALDLLASRGPGAEDVLWRAFERGQTMTEWMAALEALGASGGPRFDDALALFYAKWRARPLVIDKWFAVQAAAPRSDALARVEALRAHADFDLRNPNRVRSVVATFSLRNLLAFHAADGGGYRFLTGVAAEVDDINPALAARLLTAFETWRRFDSGRQAHARRALETLGAKPALSRHSREMVARSLA
jgi:aminopeptidase N